MKKSYSFLFLILFGCLHQVLVNGQTIQPIARSVGKLQISIDPRMEILTTIQLLANYPVVNRDLPYSRDILNYFESFSSQEAVVMTNSLLQNYGFSYDAPVIFMLYLSELPKLEPKIVYTDYLKGRSGEGDNLEQYRKAIKQFAETSNFEAFWNSKIPFYNQILDLTIADMGEKDLVKVLEDYFNETQGSYNVVISPSFRGGYGPKITDADGKDMIFACLGTTNMKDNIPYFDGMNLLLYVWHEFGHSFVNPAIDKYSDRVESLNKLFEPIKEDMAKIAYEDWKTCVYEHILRATNIRLYELHLGTQYSRLYLENELKQRFIYIEPLIDKLKKFESQRDKNNVTFSEFCPELLNVLDSLQKIEYWKQMNPNFNGPIIGAIMRNKLAVIYPTHDLDTEALKMVQEQAVGIFDRFFKSSGGLLLADTAALKTDLSEYGIIVFGTIESNLFLKRYASTFPFRIENQTIYADKEYTDKDIKFISCVPNPHNPQKGMSIFTALSNRATQGMSDIFYEQDFQFLSDDFILFLNRETVISRGFYKKNNEKWTF